MKKSEFREFVKEMFIDLIRRDDEVRGIVLEFVQENSELLVEVKGPSVPQEPKDAELYDKIVLVASGQEKKFLYEGKNIKTPNYGVGFKSGKQIKEWSDKIYSKIGGQWVDAQQQSGQHQSNHENIAALQSMFGGAGEGEQGSRLLGVAKTGNDVALKEAIRSSVSTKLLDENFQPTNVDMADILADTAKTTLQSFPSAHGDGTGGGNSALSATSGMNAREAFTGTPEQAFGNAAVGNWAALAFSGMEPGGE